MKQSTQNLPQGIFESGNGVSDFTFLCFSTAEVHLVLYALYYRMDYLFHRFPGGEIF